MDELKQYVDSLFSHQKASSETADLKDEIYSNMLARKNDLVQQGFPEAEAIKQAKAGIVSVDSIIGEQQLTYVNRYKTEKLQTLLLAGTILWILSIPTILVGIKFFSVGAFLLVVLLGILYLTSRKKEPSLVAFVDKQACKKGIKNVWLLWSIFFLVCSAAVSAVLFGSNLWFSRPRTITGPYQLGVIIARYYLPLAMVVFPIAVSNFSKILRDNEKMNGNE